MRFTDMRWIHLQFLVLIGLVQIEKSLSSAGQETMIGIVGPDFVMVGADSSSSSSITITSKTMDKIKVLVDPLPTSGRYTGSSDTTHQQQAILAMAAGDIADGERLLDRLRSHAIISEYESGIGCDVECVYDGRSFKGHQQCHSIPGLDAGSIAHLAREEISSSLRSRNRLSVCMFIAGMVRSNSCISHSSGEVSLPSMSTRIQTQVRVATEPYTSSLLHEKKVPPSRAFIDTSSVEEIPSTILKPKLFWIDEYGAIQDISYGSHGYGSNFALSILDREYFPHISKQESAQLIRHCFDQLRERYVINNPNPPTIKCIDSKGCSYFKL